MNLYPDPVSEGMAAAIDPKDVTEVVMMDYWEYPEFCDAYIESAVWKDSGEPLTDDELEKLQENGDFVYQQAYDAFVNRY